MGGMNDHINEVLAKAWIVCDPNRHPNDPQEPITIDGKECPRWVWFLPRAEAMRDFLSDNGLVIRPKERS